MALTSTTLFAGTVGVLPLMLNERLSVSAAREWFKVARALLEPDWLAMVDGYDVRSLLSYQQRTVPPALPGGDDQTVAGAVTHAQSAAQAARVASVEDDNRQRQLQHDQHDAELRNAFFKAIQAALHAHAPLRLQSLEQAHRLSGSFTKWFDGPAAFLAMEATLTQGTALAVSCEGDKHDAYMATLLVSPLASGASVDAFAVRVNTALVHHIPLGFSLGRTRPMAALAVGSSSNFLPTCRGFSCKL